MAHGHEYFPSKGACIYCVAKDRRLGDEHVVPYCLGGTHVIRKAIIQGQQQEKFSYHTKPRSLDYWLRERFPTKQNDKMAVNAIADALVRTGRFEIIRGQVCPDTGMRCKALRLI